MEHFQSVLMSEGSREGATTEGVVRLGVKLFEHQHCRATVEPLSYYTGRVRFSQAEILEQRHIPIDTFLRFLWIGSHAWQYFLKFHFSPVLLIFSHGNH